MAAELENDRQVNVRKLTQAFKVSARTVYAALMRTAKLSKKSARCVNKWFSLEMKKERFRAY
jgi:DeoR/GlpR family transcriptional regulator of sugar metabolism